MKVSQVNQILNNKKMQNQNTNFKLTKSKGGGTKGPRKPPKYFTDFANQMLEFVKEQRKVNEEQREFNKFVIDMFKKHKWIK